MRPIAISLWFDDQAEEAADFYQSVFPNARITQVARYRGDKVEEVAGKPIGSVLTVTIEIGELTLMLINGGPQFTFNESLSLMVPCDDQAEIDRYWEALTAGGGEPGQCGWLKDRYGLSWQVAPATMGEWMDDSDPERVARVTDAFIGMTKFDLEALSAAAEGRPAHA